jgi:hypothetical protein
MGPCSSAVERLNTFVADSPADVFANTPANAPVRKKCMSIVIPSGKPQTTESLCNSCYWAHIQRGFAESEEVILCAFLRPARLVPFKVSQCTDCEDKRISNGRYRLDHSHERCKSQSRIYERWGTRTRGGRT